MLKKIITLSIVTAVLLIGVENVVAQEGTGNPEQGQRRRQGQEGRAGQKGRAQRFSRRQEKDSELQTKGAEADRKIGAMGKKRQKALMQKGTPRDRVGRRSQQSRPWRNQPMQRMFSRRNQRMQGMGIGGWNRRYQCEGLCPCCQRGMCPWYEDFSGRGMGGRGRGFQGRGMIGRGGQGFRGRGMMGQGGPGFQGRGMMDQGGPGFQGRGMMDQGGPGFQGRGMMDQGGPGFQDRGMMGPGGPGFQGRGMMGQGEQGFQSRGMMGGQGPDMSSLPDSPMRGRGMGRPDSNMPSQPEQPMRGRGMGRRGGPGPFSGPGGQEPKPDNN